jgi:hypothetical protein
MKPKSKNKSNSVVKTISLPISYISADAVRVLRGAQNDYSCVTRFAIKRIEAMPAIYSNDLIKLVSDRFGYLDSHLINCACQAARGLYEAEAERKIYLDEQQAKYLKKTGKTDKFVYRKCIFGTRKLFEQRTKNEVSKEEWHLARLLPLYSIGEACKGANRKMNFDLNNQSVTLKLDKNTHISVKFNIQRNNRTQELALLQELIDNDAIAVTFRITEKQLDLMFDVTKVYKTEQPAISSRYAAVDLNPNGIGLSIWDNDHLIFTRLFDISQLTKKSGKSSNDKASVYMVNKRNHETVQIVSQISRLLKHFQVAKFGVEKLEFDMGNQNKGKEFNRLVKNIWNFSEVTRQLRKRCAINNITFKFIPAAYSSFIGNLVHQLPDPISASCELARRLHTEQLFPQLLDLEALANRWKEHVSADKILQCMSWKQLFGVFKNSGMRYRVVIPKQLLRETMSHKSHILIL